METIIIQDGTNSVTKQKNEQFGEMFQHQQDFMK